ncbi:hypothetical protein C5167_011735 [Papaver somniferum]|uniref:agamous-like MADS-box protein AGL17 n=1 Tax=Papaver somniferum TaxID=3469 RepID=UPI000E6F525B|nr:agamous-like MADS-box protein AGL17 [Papaver somniferum]RZC92325.1 hypothetical protein C5167_011735 [Papaver somniferum]
MGRKKIAIEKIDDPKKRIVTFSKRRSGIERKAAELCRLFADIIVCIIVFSPSGKAFTFSNSPRGICNVVERFVEEQKKDRTQETKNVRESKSSTQWRNVAGAGSGSDKYWWDTMDMEELGSMEKLMSLRESLAKLKQNLSARKEKLIALSSLSSSTIEDSIKVEDSITEDAIVEDGATSITEKHNLELNLRWQLNEKVLSSSRRTLSKLPPYRIDIVLEVLFEFASCNVVATD